MPRKLSLITLILAAAPALARKSSAGAAAENPTSAGRAPNAPSPPPEKIASH